MFSEQDGTPEFSLVRRGSYFSLPGTAAAAWITALSVPTYFFWFVDFFPSYPPLLEEFLPLLLRATHVLQHLQTHPKKVRYPAHGCVILWGVCCDGR